MVEVEPNLLLYVYGGFGTGGGIQPFQGHSQLLRVTADGLEPVPYKGAVA